MVFFSKTNKILGGTSSKFLWRLRFAETWWRLGFCGNLVEARILWEVEEKSRIYL